MEISKNSLSRHLSDTLLKSVIFNTIIEVFKNEKKIDIKNYLISVKQVNNIFLVKTTKPIINNELYLLNEIIEKSCKNKLKKMWFNLMDFEIKYK